MFTVIAEYPGAPSQGPRAFGPFESWESAEAFANKATTHASLKHWNVKVHVASVATPTLAGVGRVAL